MRQSKHARAGRSDAQERLHIDHCGSGWVIKKMHMLFPGLTEADENHSTY